MSEMKVRVLVALLVVGWPQLGGPPAAVPDALHDPYPEEQLVIAETLRGLFRAAEERNFEKVWALHLDSPKFSKFDEFGLGRENAEEARAAEQVIQEGVKSFESRIEALKVDVFGGTAVATFLLHYSAETTQGHFAATLRSTVVFVKDSSTWRIAHEHFSPLKVNQQDAGQG